MLILAKMNTQNESLLRNFVEDVLQNDSGQFIDSECESVCRPRPNESDDTGQVINDTPGEIIATNDIGLLDAKVSFSTISVNTNDLSEPKQRCSTILSIEKPTLDLVLLFFLALVQF